jgi:arsenical pump membrane protein
VNPLVDALTHTWEPFVLVVGLLLIGHVAAGEGFFAHLGRQCARVPGGPRVVLVVTLLGVAVVTAVLNLDTSVVFMTPVALAAARSLGSDEAAFLYGTLLMSNAASTLLLGSNLTNMLVTAAQPVRGAAFAAAMVLPWIASVVVTIAVVVTWRWRALAGAGRPPGEVDHEWGLGPGAAAAAGAVVAMLVSAHPALVVAALGVVVEGIELVRGRVRPRDAWSVANPAVVAPLFVLAVGVGWLGRTWDGPARLIAHGGVLGSAFVATVAATVVNNLPAATLFAGHRLAHPMAVLLGLDLGPNLFVTGAMSSMLWLRVARRAGGDVGVARLTAVGAPTAVLTLAAALAVL